MLHRIAITLDLVDRLAVPMYAAKHQTSSDFQVDPDLTKSLA